MTVLSDFPPLPHSTKITNLGFTMPYRSPFNVELSQYLSHLGLYFLANSLHKV